jgi:hypothetical protein
LRWSKARAINGCEYMTGGTVAVLGKTGRNFAAGMSGGVAYVYDEDGQFAKRCNLSMVTLEKVLPAAEQKAAQDVGTWHRGQTDEEQLKKLLDDHLRWTGSRRARELLDNWATAREKFVKVFPTEYKRALGEIHVKKQALAQTSQARAATKKEATPPSESNSAWPAADLLWERGEQDFLSNRYSRRHLIRFDGGAVLAGSSSPHVVPQPWSDASAVDPEEAFVASLSSCHMLWFLSIAAKRGVCVDATPTRPRA